MCLKLSTQGCFQVIRLGETISLPTLRRAILISSLRSIDASIYHTSVLSLVDFRKPPCGTAPSVIPIKRGNNATSCRCAFLTRFFLFLSPCFFFLLPGADMSSFVLGLRVSEMYSRVQKNGTILTYDLVDHRCISNVSGYHRFRPQQ